MEELREENSTVLRKAKEAEEAAEKAKKKWPADKNNFADLKAWVIGEFDQMEEKLDDKREKFKTLNEAVETEKKNLEKIHQIKAEADSLEVLLLTKRKGK